MSHSKPLHILQITDIHFRQSRDGAIYGVETQSGFEAVLSQIKGEIELDNRPLDLILATGDISQDGSVESYQRFLDFVSSLNAPCYFLQGNHDYTAPMLKVFGERYVSPCKVAKKESGAWNIVMLNSSVEDQVNGHFGKSQLEYLASQLSANKGAPTLICFHHHPMSINCRWLDQQTIDNADDFFKIIDQYENVKFCIYGHIHQEREVQRKGVSYIATPSTCAQFAPELDDFMLDDQKPGYRWINCMPDGSFETELVRLRNK